MDRRQKKSREAILRAFSELLAEDRFDNITVKDIIERADIGRATFYAHFETKDYLLKELCRELFCHVFDSMRSDEGKEHRHIFECEAPKSAFLHILQHLSKDDNGLLKLLSCPNNELFLRYFKEGLRDLVSKQDKLLFNERFKDLPEDFCINYIASTFVEAVKWWISNGMTEPPEIIADYFEKII